MKHVLFLFFLPFLSFSQEIKGTVFDKNSGERLIGVKIQSSESQRLLTDSGGNFTLPYTKLPIEITCIYSMYDTLKITVSKNEALVLKMKNSVKEVSTVVVSAGRRSQAIEEVPISMEILKPTLIDNKGISNLEQAVDQSPGVYAMDGQVSIRGGSGFAYGAGSRVLLLWNGIPLITGDAGDTKWNAVPLELASQIEIMKGASSVLYGSGALNGIISLTEREPGLEGETRFKIQGGMYDKPKRESLRWNSSPQPFGQFDVYHGKMYKKFGYTISANGFNDQGYREGEIESRGRVSGTLFFRPEKIKNLKAGIGYNFQVQKSGVFIIWESDSLGYSPSGGADTSNAASTLTYNLGLRINVDPYLKYVDKYKNIHNLKTRVYYTENRNFTNLSQSSTGIVYYGDYQFQRSWKNNMTITTGYSSTYTTVQSQLFGDHFSFNTAVYGQYDQKIKKLNLTAGVRMEYFEQDNKRGDSEYTIGNTTLPVYPVFRTAAHYQLFKYTHLRGSIGQGVRYPSVAERYTITSVGSLNIFPNANLVRETGWAAEIGIKQGVKLGGGWKGLIDVAGFINQYDNMMEFAFGFYSPIDGEPILDNAQYQVLANQGYTLTQMLGFRATNAEKARISGVEFSFNSEGKIKNVDVRTLIGYTYMNPISLNMDSAYRSTFSDTSSNILKYRFRHLVKADVEAEWKGISAGFSARYNSNMDNIDEIFERDIDQNGLYILPGLKEYREKNNKGALVFDARVGYQINDNYRLGFIVNNLLNQEYATRPGDIQAPRSFILQVQMKF